MAAAVALIMTVTATATATNKQTAWSIHRATFPVFQYLR